MLGPFGGLLRFPNRHEDSFYSINNIAIPWPGFKHLISIWLLSGYDHFSFRLLPLKDQGG
jgi:hypothetical protein